MKYLKFISITGIIVLILLPAVGTTDDTPEEVKRQISFGVRAAQEDHWNEAVYRWRKVLQIDADNLMAHNNLAVAYEQMGEYALAMEEYELAYRLNSENDVVKSNLERFKEFYRKYQQRRK